MAYFNEQLSWGTMQNLILSSRFPRWYLIPGVSMQSRNSTDWARDKVPFVAMLCIYTFWHKHKNLMKLCLNKDVMKHLLTAVFWVIMTQTAWAGWKWHSVPRNRQYCNCVLFDSFCYVHWNVAYDWGKEKFRFVGKYTFAINVFTNWQRTVYPSMYSCTVIGCHLNRAVPSKY
jgi:hypothetical protein